MEVTAVLLSIIIIIVTVALYLFKRNLNYWKDRGIPHEEPHIVMGNFKGVRTKYHIAEISANLYQKFKGTGPFAGIYIMQRPAVLLLDKFLIKNVLMKDFKNFTDRGLYYNEKTDPLTGHLFLLDGQKWHKLRKKLSPTFTSCKMKYMYPTLLNVTDQLIHILSENVKANNIVNINDIVGRFSADIISSCAFGIECNSLANPNSEFPKMGKKSLAQHRHNAFISVLIDSFPHVARLFGMRILPEDVHQFFMRTIRDTIAYREEHKIKRKDFLNILLELKNDEHNQSDEEGLSVEEICAQVFVFFLGGFDTSSSTIAYALYELTQHPDMQERLRLELEKVMENSPDGKVTYDNLKDMIYLEQVLSETLRKYPVVPQIFRKALNDYPVPGFPEYVIKKGMPIFLSLVAVHYDPEYYPDPHKFDPGRFSPEMAKLRDPEEYMPFGYGPRNCIGQRFGQMQTRLGLANLIRNFCFAACSKTETPLTFDPKCLTYVPKNVIYLKVEKIM